MRARIYAVVLMMSLVGVGGCSSSKTATDSPVASVDATLALEPAAIPDTTAAPDTTAVPDTTLAPDYRCVSDHRRPRHHSGFGINRYQRGRCQR